MKTITKKERRAEQLARHYQFLENFSEYLGNKQDGKKLSNKLRALELRGNRLATDYCNGDIGQPAWEFEKEHLVKEVLRAFNVNTVPGLFVNGDARGYALKIDDAEVRRVERETQATKYSLQFYRDMGGYGILSPEITGD